LPGLDDGALGVTTEGGTQDKITANSSYDPWSGTTSFTAEWWGKTSFTGAPSHNMQIFASDTGGQQLMLHSITGAGRHVSFFYSGLNSTTFAGAWPNDTNWHHFMLVWDNTTLANCKLFVDGSDTGISPSATGALGTTGVLALFNRGTSANIFNGTLDEMALYRNVRLSVSNALAHYTAGVGSPVTTLPLASGGGVSGGRLGFPGYILKEQGTKILMEGSGAIIKEAPFIAQASLTPASGGGTSGGNLAFLTPLTLASGGGVSGGSLAFQTPLPLASGGGVSGGTVTVATKQPLPLGTGGGVSGGSLAMAAFLGTMSGGGTSGGSLAFLVRLVLASGGGTSGGSLAFLAPLVLATGGGTSGGSLTVAAKQPLTISGGGTSGGSAAISVPGSLAPAAGGGVSGGSMTLTVRPLLTLSSGGTSGGSSLDMSATPGPAPLTIASGGGVSGGTASMQVAVVLGSLSAGGTSGGSATVATPQPLALASGGGTSSGSLRFMAVMTGLSGGGTSGGSMAMVVRPLLTLTGGGTSGGSLTMRQRADLTLDTGGGTSGSSLTISLPEVLPLIQLAQPHLPQLQRSVMAVITVDPGGLAIEATGTHDGPKSPATLADATGVGSTAWTNPASAQLQDGVGATAPIGSSTFVDDTHDVPNSQTQFAGAAARSGSGYPWSNLSNALTDNDQFAQADVYPNDQSENLQLTNFGFNIPSDATIDGITATISRLNYGNVQPIQDRIVELTRSGTISSNKASGANWPVSGEAAASYGGVTDKWGLTWTPAQINAAGFGILLGVKTTGSTDTTALKNAGSGVNDSGTGTTNWGTPNGIATGSVATIGDGSTIGDSHYLKAQNYGFAIPSTAEIRGILVAIDRTRFTTSGSIIDNRVKLFLSGAVGTEDKGGTANWPNVETVRNYGGSGDTWSQSITPAQVNAANFGCVLAVHWDHNVGLVFSMKMQITYATAAAALVDYMKLKVDYHQTVTGSHIDTATGSTHYLKATNFGFSIPSGVTINGIVATIVKRGGPKVDSNGTWTEPVFDTNVRIVKGGTIQTAQNKAQTGTAWPTGFSGVSYGGAGDLWGTTWTQADINSTGFGIAIAAQGGPATPEIDSFMITVYYTVPGSEVAVTAAQQLRFSPDESDVGKVLTGGTEWGSEMPGGFSAATLHVSRPEFFDPSDYLYASVVIMEYESARTLHEGRVVGISDNSTSEVAFEIEGHGKSLEDNKGARVIFYDRDFANWQGASVAYKINDIGNNWVEEDASVVPDPTSGESALECSHEGNWIATQRPDAIGVYDAQGLDIRVIDYAWKRASTTSSASWWWGVGAAADANLTTSLTETSNLNAAGPGSGSLTIAAGRKFALAELYWNAATAQTGADNTQYAVWWTLLAVVGDHGLTLRGSVSVPDNGRGLYASDMIGWTVGQFATKLNLGDIEVTSSFIVPHASYRDRTTALDIIEGLCVYGGNSLYPLDWWVEEGRTFRLASPENHGTTWRIKLEDGATQENQGLDVQRLLNGVIVTYDDGSGVIKSVGPPGSDADSIDSNLIDTSDTNPANRDGQKHWEVWDAGIQTQAGAILVGKLVLAERNRQTWRGSIVVPDGVRDASNNWEPVTMVRAGDSLIVEDDPGDDWRPRRIVSADYDHDSDQVTCSIGALPDRFESFMAKAQVVLVGKL